MPVRVLLVDLPPLDREVLAAALAAHPDEVEVVGVAAPGDLDAVARETEADVVVTALVDGAWPASCDALVEARTRVRLLGVGVGEPLHRQVVLLAEDRAVEAELGPAEVVAAVLNERA
jgi:DNA-binding NarL/FixJ family response regulator